MFARNVVKIGNSYYVSIPKKWVESFLKESKTVFINILSNGVIELHPIGHVKEKKVGKCIKIDFCEGITRHILGAYLNGYDLIEILHHDNIPDSFLPVLEDLLRRLIGLEVVEEEPRRIVLQCFTNAESGLDLVVKRMDSVTRSMYSDAVRAWMSGNRALAESVMRRDDKVDKLYFFAVRNIRKSISDPLLPSEEKLRLLDLRLVVQSLERIGDLSESLACSYLKKHRKKPLTSREDYISIEELVRELGEYQKNLIEIVLSKSWPFNPRESLSKGTALRSSLAEMRDKLPSEHRDVMACLEKILNELNDILDLIV
ncbi:MAG: hypothetical protein DRJ51_01175 [Thermoprotei archaeon]|nr:MAG: hypothetical protein DRJ51_01175 [Thermoprotei archaeon]RLF03357.1 MAG: hypothetical protein DRJ59_00890 [Thermoprotei archaeon]